MVSKVTNIRYSTWLRNLFHQPSVTSSRSTFVSRFLAWWDVCFHLNVSKRVVYKMSNSSVREATSKHWWCCHWLFHWALGTGHLLLTSWRDGRSRRRVTTSGRLWAHWLTPEPPGRAPKNGATALGRGGRRLLDDALISRRRSYPSTSSSPPFLWTTTPPHTVPTYLVKFSLKPDLVNNRGDAVPNLQSSLYISPPAVEKLTDEINWKIFGKSLLHQPEWRLFDHIF